MTSWDGTRTRAAHVLSRVGARRALESRRAVAGVSFPPRRSARGRPALAARSVGRRSGAGHRVPRRRDRLRLGPGQPAARVDRAGSSGWKPADSERREPPTTDRHRPVQVQGGRARIPRAPARSSLSVRSRDAARRAPHPRRLRREPCRPGRPTARPSPSPASAAPIRTGATTGTSSLIAAAPGRRPSAAHDVRGLRRRSLLRQPARRGVPTASGSRTSGAGRPS